MATDINGWVIGGKAGELTLTKGEEVITATYLHDDHELALDHAVAQAWAIDNPQQALDYASDQKPAAIVRWSKGQAWTRLNMPLADGEVPLNSVIDNLPDASAPTADEVNAFITEQREG